MITRYQHTQVGYLMIAVMTAAIVLLAVNLAVAGINWVGVAVLIVLGVALVLFSSLTVTIQDGTLEVRFGPGPISRRFSIHEIESCRVVKNRWFYGWGIRLTPHGWLYNVSGFYAVEIKLKTGRKYRIGTDAPRELDAAIRQANVGLLA